MKIFGSFFLLVLVAGCSLAFAEPADSMSSDDEEAGPPTEETFDPYIGVHDTIKGLDEFSSVAAFENYYNVIIDTCQSYASGPLILNCRCFEIELEMWQWESESSYKRLKQKLDPIGRRLLAKTDRVWNSMDSLSEKLIGHITTIVYDPDSCGKEGALWSTQTESHQGASIKKVYALHMRELAGSYVENEEKNSVFWDKALNIYYKNLNSKLGKEGKDILKKSQLLWIKARDAQIVLSNYILNKRYEGQLDSVAMNKQTIESDRLNTMIIKQRTLMLKELLEIPEFDNGSFDPLPFFK